MGKLFLLGLFWLLVASAWGQHGVLQADEPLPAPTVSDPERLANLKPKHLVAWCIVPFDASKRSPAQRAEMLKNLGIGRSAYDWRKEHVSDFEEEILQYQKHGIEFFAFWGVHEKAFALFEKHDIHPQIWKTAPSPKADTEEEKIKASADSLEALATRTKKMESELGLYNHGGWGGEPANLVAVCEELHRRGHHHVGIVYNWHHGHDQIADWKEQFEVMKPHLLCLNLNGMNKGADPKILVLGKGEHERVMLQVVLDSGYDGPIGILDHQNATDSEETLRDNLDGLEQILGASPEPAVVEPSESHPWPNWEEIEIRF